ncbi:hypothetical protein KFE25_003521 [Diacronema lutheri]|uniref:Uncharacterized protein n=1 Tax=Diacronema lutheri TaxID=2081491 RepID=A0A8J5XHR1_DIALT|nr:hypothetical protein KFE25_003521 [Diacronema lutheri]
MAQPADVALAIYRQHDMSQSVGRLRAMQQVAAMYDVHSRELGARAKLLETTATRAVRAADEAGRQSVALSDKAFEQAERAAALEAALAAEHAVSARLREQLARAEAQLAIERDEGAARDARYDAEVARLAGLLEERRPLESRAARLDDLVGELSDQLVDAERRLRAERADKTLLARAVLRGRDAEELGAAEGFDVQTIVHVTPRGGVLATHLRPASGSTTREREEW